MVTSPYCSGKNGRGEKIRTSDPLLPKQVRYQAALRPDTEDVFYITRFSVLARFFCVICSPDPQHETESPLPSTTTAK